MVNRPTLPYLDWRDTLATVQLWTQIVAKVRLTLSPWPKQSGHVPLYINACGLGTGPIDAGPSIFEIDFDFVAHRLIVFTPDVGEQSFALEPMPVAMFCRRCMAALAAAGIDVTVNTLACEIANAVRSTDDEARASYNAAAVNAFWRALVQVDRVFRQSRTGFFGNTSSVAFFWGGFDLFRLE